MRRPQPALPNTLLPTALGRLLRRPRLDLDALTWRELTQFARNPRSGRWLFGAFTTTLLVLLGTYALHRHQAEPAKIGSALYQAFFSVTQLLVMMVVPQLAAISILSERAQHVWETLQLSPLGPTRIARGKFFGALICTSTFLVTTSPLGALALLFGGVTLSEFLAAYAYIAALATLSAWLGLAVAATAKTTTAALAHTLGWSMAGWITAYFGLGWGLSAVVHHAWPEVPGPAPVWFPLALVHAPVGIHSAVALGVAPLAVWAVVVALLYQLTVRAVSLEAEQKPRALQRWLLTTTPIIWLLLLTPRLWVLDRRLHWLMFALATIGVSAHGWLCQLLFCFEPQSSTRGSTQARSGSHHFGHTRAQWRVLLLALSGLAVMLALGAWQEWVNARWLGVPRRQAWLGLVAMGASAAAFLVFTGGLVVQLRRRGLAAPATRVALCLTSTAILLGPWLLAGLASLLRTGDGTPKALLAAGSPSFSLLVVQRLHSSHSDASSYLLALLLATGGWFALGTLLWLMQPQNRAPMQRTSSTPPPPPARGPGR